MMMRKIVMACVGMLAALVIGGCGYNDSAQANNAVEAAFGDLQSQYQRRLDLIPNLVRTVEAAAAHEERVQLGVAELRASATRAQGVSPGTSDADHQRYDRVQQELAGSMRQFLVIAENYPALQANQNFLGLQSQIEGTENRIAVARRDYNAAIQSYNNIVDSFPSSLGSGMRGLHHRQAFAATAGADHAPEVQFHQHAAPSAR